MRNHHQTRREILFNLQPKIQSLPVASLCKLSVGGHRPPLQTRKQFISRHFSRGDAFALGMAAGAAVVVIIFTICHLLAPNS